MSVAYLADPELGIWVNVCKPARFRCLSCDHTWSDTPGIHVACPLCRAVYVKWVDYTEIV